MKKIILKVSIPIIALTLFMQRSHSTEAFAMMRDSSCTESCCIIALLPFFSIYNFFSSDDGGDTKKVTIHGTPVTFEKQSLEYYPDGTIREGWLEGETCLLVNSRRICFGHGKMTFHPNGAISCAYLNGTDRLLVRKRLIAFAGHICFHPNGSVNLGRLAEHTSFQKGDKTFTLKPMTVVFDPQGRLTKVFSRNSLSDVGTPIEGYLRGR